MKALLSAATFGLLPVPLPHASNPDHRQIADVDSAQLACNRHDIGEEATKEESHEPHPRHQPNRSVLAATPNARSTYEG
jgi:hypothetical protein